MKIDRFFTLALASLAFAACSNDDDVAGGGTVDQAQGDPTWVSFKVAEEGVSSGSRAITGTDADESGKAAAISKGCVYIFSNGKWEQTIPFTGTTTAVTQVTTGSKQLIVLANRNEIACNSSTTFASFRNEVVTGLTGQALVTELQKDGWLLSNALDAYNATNVAGSFAGSTIDIAEATKEEVEAPTNPKNNISIKVSRAVARSKFGIVGDKTTIVAEDGDGKIADVSAFEMQYSNQAKTSYTFLQVAATQVATPFYNMELDNQAMMATYIEQDGTFGAIPTAYTYIPENTYNQPKYGQATNVYLQATYQPVNVVKGYVAKGIAGEGIIKDGSFTAGNTFIYDNLTNTYFVLKANGGYTLNNEALASDDLTKAEEAVTNIWRAIAKDKGVYDVVKEFGSWSEEAGATLKTEGTAWPTWEAIVADVNGTGARALVNPVPAQDGKYYLGHMYSMRKYTGGKSKYRIYLTDNDTNGFKGYKSVIRNYSYDVTLTGITGPGIATDEKYPGGSTEQKPGGGSGDINDPYKPGTGETTNPEDPIDPSKATYIKATIEIMPWVKVEQGATVG